MSVKVSDRIKEEIIKIKKAKKIAVDSPSAELDNIDLESI